MRFHNDLKTVLISIAVLLLFVFSSVFIIAELDLTSPTLLITNTIFQSFVEKDSPLSLSFSSMERNFRDRVRVNDIEVYYKGEELAKLDYVEVKMGIIDLISYFVTGKATALIMASDGEIKISRALFENEGDVKEGGGDSALLNNKYRFNLSLENMSLSIFDSYFIKNVSLSFLYDGGLDRMRASLSVPNISFTQDELSFDISSVFLELNTQNKAKVLFSLEDGSINNPSFNAKLGKIAGSLELDSIFDFTSYKGEVTLDSIDGFALGYDFSSSPMTFSLTNTGSSLSIERMSVNGNELRLDGEKLTANTPDFNSFSGSLSSISGEYKNTPFSLSSISIENFDINERTINLGISSIRFDNIRSFSADYIEKGSVNDMTLKAELKEGINLSLGFDSLLTPVGDLSSDLELGLDLLLNVKDKQIQKFSISSRNLYLGYGERRDNKLEIKGEGKDLDLFLNYGEMELSARYLGEEKRVKGEVNIKDYAVSPLYHFYKDSQFLESNIPLSSLLSASVSLDLTYNEASKLLFTGDISYEAFLSDVKAFGYESKLTTKGEIKLRENELAFPYLDVDTSYFSLSLDASLPYDSLLPSLSYTLSAKDESEIANGYLVYKDNSYDFNLTLSLFSDTYLKGKMSYSNDEIKGNSVLTTLGDERPFIFSIDTTEKTFGLSSPKLGLTGSYKSGIECNLMIRNLDLVKDGQGNPLYLGGDLNLSFLESGWNLSGDNIKLTNLWFIPSAPDVCFNIEGDQENIELNDIDVSISKTSFFKGKIIASIREKNIVGSFDALLGEGDVVFSFVKDEMYSGFIRARNLDLSPFGIKDMYTDVNLTGRADTLDNLSLEGKILALAYDSVNDDRKVTADIVINSNSLLLDNIKFTTSGLSVEIDQIEWRSDEGRINIGEGSFKSKGEHLDRDYPVSASFNLSILMNNKENLYNSIYNTLKDGGEGISVELTLNGIDIDNSRIVVDKKTTLGVISNRRIDFSGSLLSGSFSFDNMDFDISLDLYPLVSLSIWGCLKDEIRANTKISAFNMYSINLFMSAPLITFDECFVKGEAGILGKDGVFSINGNLSADEMGVNIFWAPDQKVIIHNPRFTLWNNDLRSSVAKATVVDYLTYERKSIDIFAGLTLTPTLSLEGYVAEMWMDENNPIRVRLPLPMAGIDILANGYGHYYMQTIDGEPMKNDGELTLIDSEVTIGMNPYPEWYDLEGSSDVDMVFNFKRNNRVVYPAGSDPIISITLDEDSSVKFVKSVNDISISGDVDIRGGEIFYFQKYFYITEGNITFPDPTKIDPKINLRATLRDYDSDSNRVEVYLVMKDNTFENISPTLESSPAKDINEIMEILGQSILPSSTYGTVSVGSVASLLTEGIDILGRLGIVTASNPLSGMSQSLKDVFGVDSFSLHSNIVNNILSDTLSSSITDNYSTYSPMARYLDGTTLNIGKYLSSSFYLQGMIHLSANNNAKDKYTFISDDLVLDTEFSLEWMNPAFKITFLTSPSYFSLYSIMDTFRFSISKTINF